jgi:hypothetical protein
MLILADGLDLGENHLLYMSVSSIIDLLNATKRRAVKPTDKVVDIRETDNN